MPLKIAIFVSRFSQLSTQTWRIYSKMKQHRNYSEYYVTVSMSKIGHSAIRYVYFICCKNVVCLKIETFLSRKRDDKKIRCWGLCFFRETRARNIRRFCEAFKKKYMDVLKRNETFKVRSTEVIRCETETVSIWQQTTNNICNFTLINSKRKYIFDRSK